ncbi:terminase small subunit [Gemmatimonadota bacterium]
MNENGLTALEEIFCHQYLIDLNGTQAYLRVKPKVKRTTAVVAASKLLSSPKVQDRIDELNKKLLARIDITSDRVLQELAVVGFSNIGDYCEWDDSGVRMKDSGDLPAGKTAAVEAVQQRKTKYGSALSIKLYDKIRALEMLGRHLNLFREKTGPAVIVNFNVPDFHRQRPNQHQEIEDAEVVEDEQ